MFSALSPKRHRIICLKISAGHRPDTIRFWTQRRHYSDLTGGIGRVWNSHLSRVVRRIQNAIIDLQGSPGKTSANFQILREQYHASIVYAMQGKVFHSPLKNPLSILDVGCDIGIVTCHLSLW